MSKTPANATMTELVEQDRHSAGNDIDQTNATRHTPSQKIVSEDGRTSIGVDHPNTITGVAQLMSATGTQDLKFFEGLINQLVDAGSKNGQPNEDTTNFMLSVIKGIEPRDQIEAMLAAQMAAVHRNRDHVSTRPRARRRTNSGSMVPLRIKHVPDGRTISIWLSANRAAIVVFENPLKKERWSFHASMSERSWSVTFPA